MQEVSNFLYYYVKYSKIKVDRLILKKLRLDNMNEINKLYGHLTIIKKGPNFKARHIKNRSKKKQFVK